MTYREIILRKLKIWLVWVGPTDVFQNWTFVLSICRFMVEKLIVQVLLIITLLKSWDFVYSPAILAWRSFFKLSHELFFISIVIDEQSFILIWINIVLIFRSEYFLKQIIIFFVFFESLMRLLNLCFPEMIDFFILLLGFEDVYGLAEVGTHLVLFIAYV